MLPAHCPLTRAVDGSAEQASLRLTQRDDGWIVFGACMIATEDRRRVREKSESEGT